MQVPQICACCGVADGEPKLERISRLLTVNIIPIIALHNPRDTGPNGESREIILCTDCAERMPLDLSDLILDIDTRSERIIAHDALLKGFLTRYLSTIWPEDTPPSFYELARLLNNIGLLTPRGSTWEYHNLQQRMARLEIDRHKLVAIRAKSSYATRIAELTHKAISWTITEVTETPALYSPMPQNGQQEQEQEREREREREQWENGFTVTTNNTPFKNEPIPVFEPENIP